MRQVPRRVDPEQTAASPPAVLASSEAAPPPRALALGEQAVASREPVIDSSGLEGTHLVAVRLERQRLPYGAVVVAVGMDALLRVQRQTRQAAFLFAVVAVLLLALTLDRLARRFVHEPLAAVLRRWLDAKA